MSNEETESGKISIISEGEILEALVVMADMITGLEEISRKKPIEEIVVDPELPPMFRRFINIRNILVDRHNKLVDKGPRQGDPVPGKPGEFYK